MPAASPSAFSCLHPELASGPHLSALPQLTVSAPGSLMIAGEHAVLYGKHALVGAVDQRVFVTLTPNDTDTITIHSALGERTMPLNTIDASKPFHFIGAILETHQAAFPSGFDITVAAEFPADVGLGSSSAVTVATLAAITAWTTGAFPDQTELMGAAITIIRDVQGMGSGADAAAAVWGGILLYKATPEVIARYPSPLSSSALPPVSLVYAGYKTATPKVIKIVAAQRASSDDHHAALFDRIDANALAANEALHNSDWTALGEALTAGQHLMEELGVCDDALSEIVTAMQTMPDIRGTKISGSGLGDCVLGIGSLSPVDWPYRAIPVHFSQEGVRLEENTP
jgi:mevalonate kinase